MKIKNNGIEHTKKESEELRAIKVKHTNIQDYLIEALAWYRELGLEIKLYTLPSKFKVDRKGTGWYGSISGEIINHVNTHLLYGSCTLWNSWHSNKDQERLFDFDSGSGGGGSKFSYDGGCCLKVSTLPLVENEKFIEINLIEFQNELDVKLKDVICTQNHYIDQEKKTEERKNPSLLALKSIKNELEKYLHEIEEKTSIVQNKINHNAIRNNTVILPEIKSGKLNLTKYNETRQKNTIPDVYKKPEVDFEEIAQKVRTFVDNNPEYFL